LIGQGLLDTNVPTSGHQPEAQEHSSTWERRQKREDLPMPADSPGDQRCEAHPRRPAHTLQ